MLTCNSDYKRYFEELLVVEDQVPSVLVIGVPRAHLGEQTRFCLFWIRCLRRRTKRELVSLSSENPPDERRMNRSDTDAG